MSDNELRFFKKRVLYYVGVRKTAQPGFELDLDLPVVLKLDKEAHGLATKIVGVNKVRASAVPATPAGLKRWHQAYTSRGLKVA